jgi:hypothetical protein
MRSRTARGQRHDPYRPTLQAAPAPAADTVAPQHPNPQYSSPPQGTVHHELWGRVGFHAYPTQAFIPPTHVDPTEAAGAGTVRIFLGQLPYAVTPMQVHWIAYRFAGGTLLHNVSCIAKRYQPASSGCVHAIVSRAGFDAMVAVIHKRLLFDDTGVWFAGSPEEQAHLHAYLSDMWCHKRPLHNLPRNPVVVQEADGHVVAQHWRGTATHAYTVAAAFAGGGYTD